MKALWVFAGFALMFPFASFSFLNHYPLYGVCGVLLVMYFYLLSCFIIYSLSLFAHKDKNQKRCRGILVVIWVIILINCLYVTYTEHQKDLEGYLEYEEKSQDRFERRMESMRPHSCRVYITSVYSKGGYLSLTLGGDPECLEKEVYIASYQIDDEEIKPTRIECSNSSEDTANCEIDTLEPFPTAKGSYRDIIVSVVYGVGDIYACVIEEENQTEC